MVVPVVGLIPIARNRIWMYLFLYPMEMLPGILGSVVLRFLEFKSSLLKFEFPVRRHLKIDFDGLLGGCKLYVHDT